MRFKIKKRKRFKCVVVICFFIVFISGLAYFIIKRLEPDFWNRVESYAVYNTEKAVNQAVYEIFENDNIRYEDLIELSKNANGEISALKVNTGKLNLLKAKLASDISRKINTAEHGEIQLNFGTVYKSSLLSGAGPVLRIKIHPANQTIIKFRDTFTQNGINHVKHTLYLDIKVSYTITAVTIRKSSAYSTLIPVADTIIVGTVPKYYGDSNLETIGEDYEPDTR